MRQRMKETIQICREEGELVGFIGGPPCPDFSIAGLQKLGGKTHGFNRESMSKRGWEGNLGRLSQSYVDLIISMHPDFFLFENVKGLWQTKHHREFFEELKGKLQNAGYKTTERLTNALEFGAPQDRDRILLFGVSKPLLQKQMYQDATLTTFDWERYKSHDLHKIKH